MSKSLRNRCLPVGCTLEEQQCPEERRQEVILSFGGSPASELVLYHTQGVGELHSMAANLCMLGVAAALLHPEVWLTAAWLCGTSPTQHWCLPSMLLQCQLGSSTIHCPPKRFICLWPGWTGRSSGGACFRFLASLECCAHNLF